MNTATNNMRASWGKQAPEWVVLLAEQCDRASQKKVAEAIRYSSAVVNQVLKNSYKGDLTAVEKAVRGAYLHATVGCPVLGDLELHSCLQHQRQKFSATNSMRVRLYRACNGGCPHARQKGFSLPALLVSLMTISLFVGAVVGVAAQFVPDKATPEPRLTITVYDTVIDGHRVTCTETVDHKTGARSRGC